MKNINTGLTVIENKILKELKYGRLTYVQWDDLYDSCHRISNIEIIEKVKNANVICLTSAEKDLLFLKKEKLQHIIDDLTPQKIKTK